MMVTMRVGGLGGPLGLVVNDDDVHYVVLYLGTDAGGGPWRAAWAC